MLFNGVSGSLHELWTTNGTAASELNLPLSAGAATTGFGLNPSDLTVFGNEVLFSGTDTSGKVGLWETNGTAGGTQKLVAGTGAVGLNPTDLTVFGNEVLFSGVDGAGKVGLWAWNGTSATELVAGTIGSGLNPRDMTVYNGEVLFNGINSSASGHGLSVGNGTSATDLVPGFRSNGLYTLQWPCAVQRPRFERPC